MNYLVRSKLTLIAPLLLGVGAAVLTTLAMHRAETRAPNLAPPPSALHAPPFPMFTPPAEPRSADLAAIERRLQGLEAQEPRRSGEAATSEPEGAPPDLEEARREARRLHDELLQRHRDEPVDRGWSGQAETLLRSDLGALAEGRSYHLTSLECKTSSCVATLEWPSYATAPQEAVGVIAAPHHVNCATSVWTPPPDDPATSYRAEVFFDCSLLRAGLAESVAPVTN